MKNFLFNSGRKVVAACAAVLVSTHVAWAGFVAPTPPPGSTPAVVEAINGYNSACSFGGTDLDDLCGTGGFSVLSIEEWAQFSPSQQQAFSETLRQHQGELIDKLIGSHGRTTAIRTAARDGHTPGFAFNGKRVPPRDIQIAAASDEGADWIAQADQAGGLGGRLGAFVNVEYTMSEQDQTPTEAGFDSDVIGVLAGVDYRFSDQFTGGLSLGYKATKADFKGYASTSDFDADNYTAAVYASYYPTNAIYLDFFGSYGFGSFETNRHFVPFNQTAKGETDGTQYGLSATAGYQLSSGALTYGPYVQGGWTRAEVDAYTETGSGLSLDVNSQELTSITSVVGFRLDYAISTGGGVIVPSLRVEWEHEFDNDSRVITAQFASDPGSFMNLSTQEPDRDYFNVGLGATMTFAGGITAFADYETILGHDDLTLHKFTGGVRFEF